MKKVLSVLLAVFMVLQLFTFSVFAEDTPSVSDSQFTGQVTAISNTANRAKVVYKFLSNLGGAQSTSLGYGITEEAALAAYEKFSDTGTSLASQVLSFASGFPGVSQAFEAQKDIYGTYESSPYNATGLNNFTKMLIISREFFSTPVFGRVGASVYVNEGNFNTMYDTTNAFLELNELGTISKTTYKSKADNIASSISALTDGEKAIITSLLSSFGLYSGSSFTFEEFKALEDIDTDLEEAKTSDEISDVISDKLNDVTNEIENSEKVGSNTSMADAVVEEVIDKAMKKLTLNIETEATTSDEGTKQTENDLSENTEDINNSIMEAKQLAKSLTQKLEGSIKKEIKAKATISVKSGDTDIETSTVKISQDTIKTLNENNVSLEIETDVSSIQVEPGTIDTEPVVDEETGTTSVVESISFKAEKVNVENIEISEEDKEEVKNSSVFDFSLIASKKNTDSEGKETKSEETVKSSEFKKPVVVKIPYVLKAGETKDNIVVFFLNDETGKLEKNDPKKTNYNSNTGILTITLNHFSKYVVKSNVVKFDDITTANWSKRFVEAMAAKGVTKGTGGDLFSPTKTLTKAEFVTMLARALSISNYDGTSKFEDVEEGTWYYNAVNSAASYEILVDNEGYFSPNAPITRQEMATISGKALVKVLGYKMKYSDEYLNQFSDGYLVRGSYRNYASMAVKESIIDGIPYSDDEIKFEPNKFTTREMAAKVIYLIYNLE